MFSSLQLRFCMKYLPTQIAKTSSLCLAFSLTFLAAAAWADAPDAGKSSSAVGITKEKPSNGPSVKVDEGYMVPYTMTIPGTDLTIDMVPVPGGSFLLGSPEDEEDRGEAEGPQIKVNVDPMWVAKKEINWAQYKEFMSLYNVFKEFEREGIRPVDESNMADAITAPTQLYEPSFTYEYGERPEQAAVTMTQYAAQQFTKWLSRITGEQYRLPTEAEWEYAARGGKATAFSWGDSADDIDDYAWYYDNADEGQEAVGTKKPNPFGLHDMHGNVAEWTVNQYTEDGYESFADKTPINATEVVKWPETSSPCVVRGGSWEMDPEELRSAARLASDDIEWKDSDPNFPKSPWWLTDYPSRGIGFRLFRSYQPLDKETITKFWDSTSGEVQLDVESRVMEGRGGYGLVDEKLPEVIKTMKAKQ
ncbi:formylglycine-generating enzyme family protein [Novipirellula sp.]|uniref:formylglycine-generating enzyme family protein n=1 Tax=Novipirellula sp. TaxID=2795430 RepID=UPI003569CA05